MSTSPTLRDARPEDAPAIAELWRDSAEAGFGPLLRSGFDWIQFDTAGGRVARGIEEGPARFVLVELDGKPMGYSAFGPTRDGDGGDVGEVWTLFVRSGAWRQGTGRVLVQHALAELAAAGFREATVWSFADNQRANAFYEAMGFTRDGTERRQDAWGRVLEVRYRQGLAR